MIDAAIHSGVFNDLYINSSSDLFKPLATQHGLKFYQRPTRLDDPMLSHEGFMPDFCQNISCDYVFMLHSTSPFVKPETIEHAVQVLVEGGYDCVFSSIMTKQLFIHGDHPVNFRWDVPYTQSQRVEPVREVCWGVTGWKVSSLLEWAKQNRALTFVGKVGFIPLSKIEAIDIDDEDDFQLAELVARSLDAEAPSAYLEKSDQMPLSSS